MGSEKDGLDNSLQDRLAAYNTIKDRGSKHNSPINGLDTQQREPNRRHKKTIPPAYMDISDDDDMMASISEEENEREVNEIQEKRAGTNGRKVSKGKARRTMILSDSVTEFCIEDDSESDYNKAKPKKGVRNPSVEKTEKSPNKISTKLNSTTSPAADKRGPNYALQGHKLIDEMQKLTLYDSADVALNEVEKMKSGSVMSLNQGSKKVSAESSLNPESEVTEIPKPAAQIRPQRARQPVKYILCDSDEKDEDKDEATEDTKFSDDE